MKRGRSSSNLNASQYRPKKKPRLASMPVKQTIDYRILSQPRGEYKVTDYKNVQAATTTAVILNLTDNLAQGTSYKDNFIGRTLTPVSLDIRLKVIGAQSNAFAAADLFNCTRVLIFQWLDSAIPSASSVLEEYSAGYSEISAIRRKNYELISVLSDKTYHTWIQGTTSGGYTASNGYEKRIYIKQKKLAEMLYDKDTDTWQRGNFFALIVSDSGVTPNPYVTLYSRLTFLDM